MSVPTVLTPDVIQEILEHEVVYQSEYANGDTDVKKICEGMVAELSPDQQEQAARTSYAYYVASTSSNEELHALATNTAQHNMAMRMARRHYVQTKGDRDEATKIMKEAIAFRRERRIDSLRNCFAVEHDGMCASLKIRKEELPDEGLMETYRPLVVKDLKTQAMVVRGHDKMNRAILIKFPRTSPETDEEAYLLAHLYLAERAMAATEIISRGKEEKILVVLDFADYESACKPPRAAMKRLIPLLQTNYPERVDHIVIVEPLFWMRAVFKLLWFFIDEHTREKIVMVTGEKERISKLQPMVSPDQAMTFMLPEGKLTTEVNVDHFLEDVPFFSLYDSTLV